MSLRSDVAETPGRAGMDGRKTTSSDPSGWLPPADLSGGSRRVGGSQTEHGGTPGVDPDSERPRQNGRRALTGVLVGAAIAGGIAFGLLSRGGESGAGNPGETLSSAELLPRAQFPRVELAGVLGPSEALSLAVEVQTQDQRSADRGEPAIVGRGPDRVIRAQYILRLAAVGAVLRELGRKASRVRDAAGLGREDDRVREALQRLDAVAGDFEDSINRRSRDLDARVAATIAGMEERLDPGREEEVRHLGRRLSAVGGSITRTLREAAAAAADGKTIQAARLFAKADRRLAAVDPSV